MNIFLKYMPMFLSSLSFGIVTLAATPAAETTRDGFIVNADEVLASPPPHEAKVEMVNGAMAIVLDGRPFGSMGLSAILDRNLSDGDIAAMMGMFQLNYTGFCLGEDKTYLATLDYGSTWLGDARFDWAPLDRQLARIQRFAPHTKLIVKVALDGAHWWTAKHPDAAANPRQGIPDYLAPEWRSDARKAIRQMVAHIQSSPYADMVIGYSLFNGPSLDCNWRPNLSTPAALAEFRKFLRQRYSNNTAALRQAWRDSKVNFAEAMPDINRDSRQPNRFPLLNAPADQARRTDTRDFIAWAWEQPILDFAACIKEATQRRALVGARTGNLMFGYWGWEDQGGFGYPGDIGSERVNRLLESPDLDFFDQWASYFGRTVGSGDCGGPVMPVKGLQAYKKMVMLQNDVPTHANNEPGYGATKSAADTHAMQRRIFAHALTQGMYMYLWQMSSNFNVPEMAGDWKTMQSAIEKSVRAPRGSEVKIAFVVDRDLQRYLGEDREVKHPTRGIALMDYGRLEWGRAGVGFDLIYLDQLADAPTYPVYVFYHTIKADNNTVSLIHRKLQTDHAVGVFVWADGMVDGNNVFSVANASRLCGIKLKEAANAYSLTMRPTVALTKLGFPEKASLGYVFRSEDGDRVFASRSYPPNLEVADLDAEKWGTDEGGRAALLAIKQHGNWTSVYSASPILVPDLLRIILRKANVTPVLQSDDALYLNQSFVGVHTRPETKSITLQFSVPTALYEIFSGKEFPPAVQHRIEVNGSSTYLYYRGTKTQWEQL